MLTVSSTWPKRRSSAKSHTPKAEPAKPPISSTAPMWKSTLPRRQCAITPDTEHAREEPHRRAEAQEDDHVHGNRGNRQVDVHAKAKEKCCAGRMRGAV